MESVLRGIEQIGSLRSLEDQTAFSALPTPMRSSSWRLPNMARKSLDSRAMMSIARSLKVSWHGGRHGRVISQLLGDPSGRLTDDVDVLRELPAGREGFWKR
jgi:hypothetical protein